MISNPEINRIFKQTISDLKVSELIDDSFVLEDSAVIVGEDSLFDSIAFVSLITALEDSLSDLSGKTIHILIDQIPAVDIDNPKIKVIDLKNYVLGLLGEKT